MNSTLQDSGSPKAGLKTFAKAHRAKKNKKCHLIKVPQGSNIHVGMKNTN